MGRLCRQPQSHADRVGDDAKQFGVGRHFWVQHRVPHLACKVRCDELEVLLVAAATCLLCIAGVGLGKLGEDQLGMVGLSPLDLDNVNCQESLDLAAEFVSAHACDCSGLYLGQVLEVWLSLGLLQE